MSHLLAHSEGIGAATAQIIRIPIVQARAPVAARLFNSGIDPGCLPYMRSNKTPKNNVRHVVAWQERSQLTCVNADTQGGALVY